MESGDLSLEESLKIFEEGIKLSKDCQNALSEAEKKYKRSCWKTIRLVNLIVKTLKNIESNN